MRTTLVLFSLLLLAALPVSAATVTSHAPAETDTQALPEAPEIDAEVGEEDADLEELLSALANDEPQETVPPFCDTVDGTSCSSPGSTKLCSVTYTTRSTCTCSSGYQWECAVW